MTDRDIFLIEVSRRGRDGDYTGASEVAALDTRVDALEARPIIDSIDDIMPGATTGQVPIKQSGGTWAPGVIAAGITVQDDGGGDIRPGVTTIVAWRGLNVTAPSGDYPTIAYLDVQFAGSGSAFTAARSDHTHTVASIQRPTYGPTGIISGGTRQVVPPTGVTLAAGVMYLVKATLKPQMRGADTGACYYTMTVTIDSNSRTSPGGVNGFWCVQGVPNKDQWSHAHTIMGTGAAITVSASVAYHSGSALYVDAGELEIELIPNR